MKGANACRDEPTQSPRRDITLRAWRISPPQQEESRGTNLKVLQDWWEKMSKFLQLLCSPGA